jgi:hypothetical protein
MTLNFIVSQLCHACLIHMAVHHSNISAELLTDVVKSAASRIKSAAPV